VELNDAVAVVTGASSGIGERTAIALARRGASVVLAARRMDRLEALSERIGAAGGDALPVGCDVTDRVDLERLRSTVETAFGRVDVLVNNAGIPGGGPFEGLSLDAIERVVRVNLLGVMECTAVLLPMMLQEGRGHIVNVASLAGRFATPGAAVYGATKHGVVAFSEALYHELHRSGLLVTSVNPGYVPTEGFPASGRRGPLVLKPDRIASTIVRVVEKGIAPEISIPRWAGALQVFRVLTPPLYRWGVGIVSDTMPPPP
jgi:short-subunit dehydrogenase